MGSYTGFMFSTNYLGILPSGNSLNWFVNGRPMVGWISAHTVFMVCNSYRRKMCVVLFARGICKKGQPCSCISEMLSQNWLVGKTLPLWLIGSHVTSVHLQWKKPSETYRIISGTKLTPPQGFGDAKPSDQGMIFPPRQCRSQWAFGTICCAR